jgi:dTDP-4-dehydrorhamnose reductase
VRIDPAVVDDQHGRLTFAADLTEVLLDLVVEQAPYGTRHVTNAGHLPVLPAGSSWDAAPHRGGPGRTPPC